MSFDNLWNSKVCLSSQYKGTPIRDGSGRSIKAYKRAVFDATLRNVELALTPAEILSTITTTTQQTVDIEEATTPVPMTQVYQNRLLNTILRARNVYCSEFFFSSNFHYAWPTEQPKSTDLASWRCRKSIDSLFLSISWTTTHGPKWQMSSTSLSQRFRSRWMALVTSSGPGDSLWLLWR